MKNRKLEGHLLKAGTVGSFLGALLVGPTAGADEMDLAPIKDNTLFSFKDGSNSSGAGQSVFSGKTGPFGESTIQRAVLAFDVAGVIPAGSTITSAELTLTLLMSGPAGSQSHTLHRIQQDWGEGASNGAGGMGAPSQPCDATWIHTYFPGDPCGGFWDNAGGDFEKTPSCVATVGTLPGPYTWVSKPAMIEDVQGWLDDPDNNFGWLVMGNESAANSAKKLASREHVTPASRPVLSIGFEPPASCPWDLTEDGFVGVGDMLALFGIWGPCPGPPGCPGDFNEDGFVGVGDMLEMFANWGPCP